MLHTTIDDQGARLILDGHDVVAIDRLRRVRVVAAGKAAAAMLSSLLARLPLPPSCDLKGVLIAGERAQDLPATIEFFRGGHPVPNAASFAGASAALLLLQALGAAAVEDTLCLFLLSGGAPARSDQPPKASRPRNNTTAGHHAPPHSGAT